MSASPTGSAVVVAVRVRPISPREVAMGAKVAVTVNPDRRSMTAVDPTALVAIGALNKGGERIDDSAYARHFIFDHCFDSSDPEDSHCDDQQILFEKLGQNIIDNAWAGYNASLFAYGQTGAGKSYSMMGTGGVLDNSLEPRHYGLIPRISHALFKSIEEASQGSSASFSVQVSYMEIYNETVHDLFASTKKRPSWSASRSSRSSSVTASQKGKLKVREHPLHGVYVQGLTTVQVVSYSEIGQLMVLGGRTRTVAETNMNEQSSRSHAIFTLKFTQRQQTSKSKEQEEEKVSKINMVDLAGSERVDQTGASGERLREARNINKSLATLCDVVKSLAAQRSSSASEDGKGGPNGSGSGGSTHVPYRNSILTWLLKESLGGNARTTMLAAISPTDIHFEETLSTLKYAERAKRMRTKAIINARTSDEHLIAQLRREVAELKRQLAKRNSRAGSGASSRAGRLPAERALTPIKEADEEAEDDEGSGGAAGLAVQVQELQRVLQEKEELIGQLTMFHLDAALASQSASDLVGNSDVQGSSGAATAAAISGGEEGRNGAIEGGTPTSEASSAISSLSEAEATTLTLRQNPNVPPMAVKGVALPGDTLDPTRPRLVNLNQDPLFSECLVYYVTDGGATIIGSSASADIQLSGQDMKSRHAVLTSSGGLVYLCPLLDAATHLNGRLIVGKSLGLDPDGQDLFPVALHHGARLVFGRHHVFRFEQPQDAPQHDEPDPDPTPNGVVIDWEFAQQELLEKTPNSPIFRARSRPADEVQSLVNKVRELEAERTEYRSLLEQSIQSEEDLHPTQRPSVQVPSAVGPASELRARPATLEGTQREDIGDAYATAEQHSDIPSTADQGAGADAAAFEAAPLAVKENPLAEKDPAPGMAGRSSRTAGPVSEGRALDVGQPRAQASLLNLGHRLPPQERGQQHSTWNSTQEHRGHAEPGRQEAPASAMRGAEPRAWSRAAAMESAEVGVEQGSRAWPDSGYNIADLKEPVARTTEPPSAKPLLHGGKVLAPAESDVLSRRGETEHIEPGWRDREARTTQDIQPEEARDAANPPVVIEDFEENDLRMLSSTGGHQIQRAQADVMAASFHGPLPKDPLARTGSSSAPQSPNHGRARVALASSTKYPSLRQIEAELRHSRRQTLKAQSLADQAKKRLEEKSNQVRLLQEQVKNLMAATTETGPVPATGVENGTARQQDDGAGAGIQNAAPTQPKAQGIENMITRSEQLYQHAATKAPYFPKHSSQVQGTFPDSLREVATRAGVRDEMTDQARRLQLELAALRQRVEVAQLRLTKGDNGHQAGATRR